MPQKTKDARLDAKYVDQCIFAVASDDLNALAMLYEATDSVIYAYTLSILRNAYDAQDVLHDVYVKVYESAHNYVSQGKPMAWLLTITKNLCYSRFRKQSRFVDISDEDLEKQIVIKPDVSVEDKLVVTKCLSKLGEDERQIVVLHAMSGLKHKDIAKLMELPLSTVLSKYNRALKKLQKIYENV